ncbi:Nickel-transporting ATPase [Lentibacillus sp. JNUCC-1]|nr:Nickel-transporting ATPase [Lentibacillus sp. JNUCC-1]
MIMMQLNGVSKSFGAETIVENIKLEVKDKDRIAIVGRNGAGKSTVLKIMNGMLDTDEGEVIKPKDVSTGYLSQHTGLESDQSIWEEMLSVFSHFRTQEQQLRRMEQQMGRPDELNDGDYQKLLHDYDTLQHAFEKAGGTVTKQTLRQFYPD